MPPPPIEPGEHPIEHVVKLKVDGQRLDQYLAAQFPDFSRDSAACFKCRCAPVSTTTGGTAGASCLRNSTACMDFSGPLAPVFGGEGTSLNPVHFNVSIRRWMSMFTL